MRCRLRDLPWGALLLSALGLFLAWQLQRFMEVRHLEYYSFFSVSAEAVQTEIQGEDRALLGPCDLFMYRSSQALGGFLSFLLLFLGFTVVGRVLVGSPEGRHHRSRLVLWSLFFLLVALGAQAAVAFLVLALLLILLQGLPLKGAARAGAIALGAMLFFATRGNAMLVDLADSWFVAPGVPALTFPTFFVALAVLIKTFRRVLWMCLEAASGALPRLSVLDGLVYLLGLPFLMGNAVTPSPTHVLNSRSAEPSTLASAGRTLIVCLGVAPLLLTALSTGAHFPSVRLLFPNCDLAHVDVIHVWGRILVSFPIEYLFLLVTEQGSVGIARLFGYGLKDNFDRPLLASNPAMFWRRWDIYWREFLLGAFYFPLALTLARRSGGPRRWHLLPAIFVTFAGTWALNLLPLVLLGGLDGKPVDWSPLVLSLAVYYFLDAVAVAATALAVGRNPMVSPEAGKAKTPVLAALSVIGTFVLMACLRVFLNAQLEFDEQVTLLMRGFSQ